MQMKSTENLPVQPVMEEDTFGPAKIGRSRKVLNAKKEEVMEAKIERYFFGYFKPWVHQANFYSAVENMDFRPNEERTEGTYTKYSSIDDRLDGFHHWFGLLKFGIGRCTANAAREVRDENITRDEGVALIHRYDTEFPEKYFKDFLEYTGMTEEEFWDVAECWRNQNLWERNGDEWKLRYPVE